MSLIVETGVGLPDANSYASVASADAYYSQRGNADWAALTTAAKESALILATDYLEATYTEAWKGERVSGTQALSWPRYDVIVDGYELISNALPIKLVHACIELALRANSGPLIVDQDQRVVREKVDVVEVEYAEFSDPTKRYPAVSRLLSSLLRGATADSGIGMARLVRA